MPRKSRKSISIKGLTYHRLKRHCEEEEEEDVSISGSIESWAYEALRSSRPKDPHFAYQVSDANGRNVHVIARSVMEAREIAAKALQNAAHALAVKDYMPPVPQQQITYAHLGVVSLSELEELAKQTAYANQA